MNHQNVSNHVGNMRSKDRHFLEAIRRDLNLPPESTIAGLKAAITGSLAVNPNQQASPVLENLIQQYLQSQNIQAPAPAPAPAPASSTEYTDTQVGEVIGELGAATDLTVLQQFADAYGIATAGRNFYQLRGELEGELSANPTDPAPAAVDPLMHAWEASHPAVPSWSERMSNVDWLIPVAVAAGVLALIIAAFWLFNRDDGDSVPSGPDTPAATATPTTAPSPTPTATQPVGNDEVDELREDLIVEVEAMLTKATGELRKELVDVKAEIEGATARELADIKAKLLMLARDLKDEGDEKDNGQKPEPIDSAVTDKPEPKYSGKHRIPAVDFADAGVRCDKSFENDSSWLLCEPGALQTEVGSFRWPEAEGVTYRSNCPEGFMWYGSMGQGKITTERSTLVMQPENGLNYLVVIRCPLNDGKVDSDRNLTLTISDIVVGHAGWTPIDVLGGIRNPEDAAYVSMEWFGEQLVVSGTKSGTNCGATGCSRTIVVLHDVDSGLHERYLVTNVKGETNDADNDGIEDYGSATWEKIYTNAR